MLLGIDSPLFDDLLQDALDRKRAEKTTERDHMDLDASEMNAIHTRASSKKEELLTWSSRHSQERP